MSGKSSLYYFFKGRVALYAILEAIGIKPGDEVILPGFTCVVVPNAIVYLGAKPVYVDIDKDTYNIDINKIEEKITGKTKAIIAQHTFGIPAELDAILKIAKEHNLYVIEDSCHALGSKYKGKEVGNIGDAAFFSSQWSKPVTTGLGGWAKINNSDIDKKMKELYPSFVNPSLKETIVLKIQYLMFLIFLRPSFFWIAQDIYRFLSKFGFAIGSSTSDELDYKIPTDYKKRMADWQVHLLNKKLIDKNKYIENRKKIKNSYENLLQKNNFKKLSYPEYIEPAVLRYPVLVKDKELILKKAKKNKIELGEWFLTPVHPNYEGWEKVFYEKGSCPIAEEISQHIINLPMHEKIKQKNMEKTIDFLNKNN